MSAADLAAWRARGRRIPVTSHGHQAFIIDDGDQAAAPSETAVLIHGFPESSYSYRGALPLLRDRFARMVCFDLIGYGFSDKPAKDYTYSIFEQADVVLRVLREVSVSGCHWVSHDMGDSVTEVLARLNDTAPPGSPTGCSHSPSPTGHGPEVRLAEADGDRRARAFPAAPGPAAVVRRVGAVLGASLR